ncbi:MAG: VanZ family protein [Chloroflexi bacterium]|nr:VanZ family protein [Chloroflexota bacterium]
MRRKLLLIGWIIGILFPFGWLTSYSDTYRQVFDMIFSPLWVHILMHTLLYLVLAYLLTCLLLRGRSAQMSLYHLGLLLLVIFIIALLQEGFQLLYQGRLPGADEWLDMGVDLVGGSLGLLMFCVRVRRISQR